MKGLCTALAAAFLFSTTFSQPVKSKLSPGLEARLKGAGWSGKIPLLVSVRDTTDFLKTAGVSVVNRYQNNFLLTATAAQAALLLKSRNVVFLSERRQPKEELTTGAFDLSLNKINLVHDRYPATNGTGILVSVKEQRFDTADIDFAGRHVNTGTAAATESIHASIMATIIGGGANSSSFAKGAAWGANLSSSDFATLLPDANGTYQGRNISIQNHSYGTAIENFYGADAAAYDASVYSIPALVHVFSAGNSGTASPPSGAYAGIPAFANLTGSFKMAKNVITVGHADSTGSVLPLSSRGPGYDGRIKPDLVAFGEDGSSGAAALVSGTVALLQQAYKQTHNNAYPSAALIKAILLNSADDVGAKGPDYVSGYGSLNAFGAVQTIGGNNFFEDVLSNNAPKSFVLNVPPNARQLKITLAWTDTAATANATKALVNDLDAVLVSPSASQSWLPWVLNAKPDKDSLSLAATRSTDTLNNVEQITLDNPQAGTFRLQIRATKLVTASQAFAVAFGIDTVNAFRWTYPSSSDVVKAGVKNYLRWQTNISGNGVLESSKDGSNWQTLSSSVDAVKNYFVWTAPDTLTTALLRMTFSSPAATFVSDTVVVSPATQLATGFHCNDSFLLYWNRLPATQYQVYQLGSQYLQPLLSTTDTFHVFRTNQYPSLYYAVAPRSGSRIGQRSFAINYTTQGVGCYIAGFYALLQNNNTVSLSLNLGTLYNVTQVAFQKRTPGGFQTIQGFSPTSVVQNMTDVNLTQGINRYRAQVKLGNGAVLYSDEDAVHYFPDQPVIVYPNPGPQNTAVNIIVRDQGVYSVKLYDATGRLVRGFDLNNVNTPLPAFRLPKGLYFVQVSANAFRSFTQKLVVY